jgi:hypothetical protein
MDFSNFISTFNGTDLIDIMSTVSDKSELVFSDGTGGPYYGRYFCVGDLLIQFSSLAGQTTYPSQLELSNNGTIYTLSFPREYDTTPYIVMPFPIRLGYQPGTVTDNNWGAVTTLSYITPTNFSFRLSDYAAGVGFLAIGPRPISLYPKQPFTVTGTYTIQSNSYYNTIIYFTGDGSITFIGTVGTANYFVVGAGGNGSNTPGGGGGGGGSGQVEKGVFTYTYSQEYTINVAGNNSSNSSIQGIISCTGGKNSNSTTGGTSGNGFAGSLGGGGAGTFSGGGGGGSSAAAEYSNGGSGIVFNNTTYGVGGNGGVNTATSQAASGASNTGNGGNGSNSNGVGGKGGSGIVVIYFNI